MADDATVACQSGSSHDLPDQRDLIQKALEEALVASGTQLFDADERAEGEKEEDTTCSGCQLEGTEKETNGSAKTECAEKAVSGDSRDKAPKEVFDSHYSCIVYYYSILSFAAPSNGMG